jgi:hypothetical protein
MADRRAGSSDGGDAGGGEVAGAWGGGGDEWGGGREDGWRVGMPQWRVGRRRGKWSSRGEAASASGFDK